MTNKHLSTIFFVIASAAAYFLVLKGGENQVVADSMAKVEAGEIRAVYTSFKGLDAVLGALVAFFDSSTSQPQGPPLIAIFGSVYTVALVLIHLEAERPDNPALIRHAPLATGLLCQLFGAGIFLPLYFGTYFLLATPGKQTGSLIRLKTLLPAFLLAFQPLATLTVNPNGLLISRNGAQISAALWQLFPIWMSVLHTVFTEFLASTPQAVATTTSAEAARRSTLRALGIFTTLVYWFALAQIAELAGKLGVSFARAVYFLFDFPLLHPARGPEAITVFLIWDFIFATLGAWAFVIGYGAGGRKEKAKVALQTLGLLPVFGPAAAICFGALKAGETSSDQKKVK